MITNLVFLVIILAIGWCWYRMSRNEPILPKSKKRKPAMIEEEVVEQGRSDTRRRKGNSDKKKDLAFTELIDLEEVKYRLMRLKKDRFVLVLRCEAVNYFLKSQDEQLAIDAAFEAALQIVDEELIVHTQSRRIDYDDLIQGQYQKVINNPRLNDTMKEYCLHVLDDLNFWQQSTEVYDIRRYILLPYDLVPSEKNKFKSDDDMYRRILAILSRKAQGLSDQLNRAGIKKVEICTDREIWEMLYYAFKRKSGRKYKFDHIMTNEVLSEYVTAERDEYQLELIEEEMKFVEEEMKRHAG